MSYNIFLDDERFPSDTDTRIYHIVRTYEHFVESINTSGIPDFIRFDHDLGPGKDGHDCAKYLVEYMQDNFIIMRINFQVHSQNPEGAKDIECLLNNWNKHMVDPTEVAK